MGAVSGRDNLRDNRAVRWGTVLVDNQVAAACQVVRLYGVEVFWS